MSTSHHECLIDCLRAKRSCSLPAPRAELVKLPQEHSRRAVQTALSPLDDWSSSRLSKQISRPNSGSKSTPCGSTSSIDVLVNRSGLAIGVGKVADVSEDAINAMLDTSVKSGLYCIRPSYPGLKNREGGVPWRSGVLRFQACFGCHTWALRIELVDTPINVTSIDARKVKTDFSKVRFSGDETKADAVYAGVDYLTAKDIADNVVYCASRPPRVQIASMTVFPTQQGSVIHVHRYQA
ncbi:hypothetical protein BJ742DRAFT_777926 [Cladochytrium replicatum]|nr:hypothetical protein BJ742DRAFT_777926 [Cladochytrium replicatum]